MRCGMRSSSGQATVEYVGALLLVALLFAGLLAGVGLARPAASVAAAVFERFLCAVRQGEGCRPPPDPLRVAYGADLALAVRANAPEIRFEDGEYVSLPVDPRDCRDRACSDTSEAGPLGRSFEDHPATAFVRVIDCRLDPPADGVDCSGGRGGHVYIQYWLYYPDSATRPLGRKGYHRDDWESLQVRLDPEQVALARASSHHGYNHDANPLSDVGEIKTPSVQLGPVKIGPVGVDGRAPAWGPPTGYVWVSAGSHAGRVTGGDRYFRSVPADRLRLIPMEPELGSLGRLDFAVTPPWLKGVWRDPEHVGT